MKVKYQLGFLCTQVLFAFFDNKPHLLCLSIQVLPVIYLKVNVFWVKDYEGKVTPREEGERNDN